MKNSNLVSILAKHLINPANVMLLQRREGEISMLVRETHPKHFIVFDTESYIEKDDKGNQKFPFRLGCATYVKLNDECKPIDREELRFKTIEGFVEFIVTHSNSKAPLYVFAHNIGFDMRVLRLPFKLNKLGFTSEPPIINDRCFIWEVARNKTKIIFLDTANLGVISVRKLGEDLKFPKMSVEFENVTDFDLYVYCENDVKILEIFVASYIHFIHENRLGIFRETLASQSFTAWRTSFMTNKVSVHNFERAIILEREGYHGGRVECYYIGKVPQQTFFKLDVNSMYPYVMKHKRLPTCLKKYFVAPTQQQIQDGLENYYCIARVTLKTANNAYPYINNGKLIFPIGQYSTVLHDTELRYALENDDILEIEEMACYTQALLFDEYIDFFYGIKVKATHDNNHSWRTIAKAFLVSLYGKFGQAGVERKRLGDAAIDEISRATGISMVSGIREQELTWFGSVYLERRGGESYYSCPFLAGAITAEARYTLYQYIKLAGKRNCFYVDTDSLIVNEQGYYNLGHVIDSDKLGYLKVEETADKLEIFNPKDYIFGDTIKMKGFTQNAKMVAENSWETLQFTSFNTWLNDGGKSDAQAKIVIKHRRSTYDKGVIIGENGNTDVTGYVVPITLLL